MPLPDPPFVETGHPLPLGASCDDRGVNFAVHAGDAERVELCLFDDPLDPTESRRVALPGRTGQVLHGHIQGLRPGQAYGLRAHGPWAPELGQRYNGAKLLVDPWARALAGELRWDDAVYGHRRHRPADAPLEPDPQDSAPFVPRALVIDERFDWGADAPPRTPLRDTVLYECHVKALTQLHPEVPPELRGTYLGLACEPVIEHLRALGVTAVELLPVHARVSERRLVELGLTNAWGYNTLGYLAPDARFARDPSGRRGEQVLEFKRMVAALHAAGLEVLLDVVYNHTCEGDHLGPTLSWRGLDHRGYYHLSADDPRYVVDHSGCGNALDVVTGPGHQLLLDSLRHWVGDMHVDGFRFDLAPALGRGGPLQAPDPALFERLRADPLLAGTKLIAEPWDLGPEGYQLGAFPPGWSEWNGRFRDDVREFWRGDAGRLPAIASRLAGSSDLFGERPTRSINFVSCHDGAPLRDLVSYESKHNEANGEDNLDGSDHEHGCNWGAEGETDDPAVRDVRGRVARSLFATLRLALGVPMLLAGDELWRTQRGNNNMYCQDNELLWVDWRLDDEGRAMLTFAQRLAGLARELPALRRRAFFTGHADVAGHPPDVTWIDRRARVLDHHAWKRKSARLLGMLVRDGIRGGRILLWLNGGAHTRRCRLPQDGRWELLLDSADPAAPRRMLHADEQELAVRDRALVVLRRHEDTDEERP